MFMITVICDICGKKLESQEINIIKVDNAWKYDCCNICKEKIEKEIEELINKKGVKKYDYRKNIL